jgi:hypothetical protein
LFFVCTNRNDEIDKMAGIQSLIQDRVNALRGSMKNTSLSRSSTRATISESSRSAASPAGIAINMTDFAGIDEQIKKLVANATAHHDEENAKLEAEYAATQAAAAGRSKDKGRGRGSRLKKRPTITTDETKGHEEGDDSDPEEKEDAEPKRSKRKAAGLKTKTTTTTDEAQGHEEGENSEPEQQEEAEPKRSKWKAEDSQLAKGVGGDATAVTRRKKKKVGDAQRASKEEGEQKEKPKGGVKAGAKPAPTKKPCCR